MSKYPILGEAVKIAAVTASTFRGNDAQLMAASFDAIVHKPYRSEQIFECMENLLRLRFERAQANTAPTPQPELSATALTALPGALRQELAQALVILDGGRILALLQSGPSATEATAPAGETQA